MQKYKYQSSASKKKVKQYLCTPIYIMLMGYIPSTLESANCMCDQIININVYNVYFKGFNEK